jgi:membrane-associated protease RseP (regulator of RpoE activity)
VNVVLHAALLLATVLTTLVAGANWRFDQFLAELGGSLGGVAGSAPLGELLGELVVRGGPFSLAILLILGAHESGHYVMARRYGMLVTPPFFLPAPIPPIGTFGAVIKIRSPMMHRRALLDIGLAGPVAGVVVALPILIYGLTQSEFEVIRTWDPAAVRFGHSALTWLLARLCVGAPEPGYMLDWLSHPFAWAGWIGLLITSLNLIPVGQLDGGHVAYALVGRRQRHAAYFFFGILLALAWTQWPGWAVWCVVMMLVMRVAHPPVVVEDVPLDTRRRVIGWAAMVFFVLVFMPAPVTGVF